MYAPRDAPLEVAPSLAEVGIDSLRVRRQSHILLTADEYATARRLIVETANTRQSVSPSTRDPRASISFGDTNEHARDDDAPSRCRGR